MGIVNRSFRATASHGQQAELQATELERMFREASSRLGRPESMTEPETTGHALFRICVALNFLVGAVLAAGRFGI